MAFDASFVKESLMKVHYPKLYNMARCLALNFLLLPKDLAIIFIHSAYDMFSWYKCLSVILVFSHPSVYGVEISF